MSLRKKKKRENKTGKFNPVMINSRIQDDGLAYDLLTQIEEEERSLNRPITITFKGDERYKTQNGPRTSYNPATLLGSTVNNC